MIVNLKEQGLPCSFVVVKMKCPGCGHKGTFERISSEIKDVRVLTENQGWRAFGQRYCPNNDCKAHLFFISEMGGNLIASYPAIKIDFEKQNIPTEVLQVFEEAIICHAEKCFIASAIMIRRTLEEICQNKSAKGGNLKERIKDLTTKIVLPKELIEGFDDLRLLGNDAAHVEAKEFEEISQDEIEVSIEFTKEILKAVYQYEHLLSRLRSLKIKKVPDAKKGQVNRN